MRSKNLQTPKLGEDTQLADCKIPQAGGQIENLKRAITNQGPDLALGRNASRSTELKISLI